MDFYIRFEYYQSVTLQSLKPHMNITKECEKKSVIAIINTTSQYSYFVTYQYL